MRNTIIVLLLLPFMLFSQSKSEDFSTIVNPAVVMNSTFYDLADAKVAKALNVNSCENNLSDECGQTPFISEFKNYPPTVEVLNFRFECGFIKWSTASETNCSHYLIMFSRDNKSWNILGQIYGAGNSSAMNNYKYPTDLHEVYFKMYQMDFNGDSKEYGPILGSCKKPKKP